MNIDAFAPLSYEILAAIAGWVGKTSYTSLYEHHKNKHVSNMFGEAHKKRGTCNIYIGIFSPASYDDMNPEKFTELQKINVIDKYHKEQVTVPIYSDVIVRDDYDAASKIIYLLNLKGYGYVNITDDTNQDRPDNSSLNISIGGPRSNHMTKHIICMAEKYIRIDDANIDRSLWIYEVNGKYYKPENKVSFCYILKITVFDEKVEHTYLSVAGDSSQSTLFAAEYICKENHIERISKKFRKGNFLIFITLDSSTGRAVAKTTEELEIHL